MLIGNGPISLKLHITVSSRHRRYRRASKREGMALMHYGCDSNSDAGCNAQEPYFHLGEIGGGPVSGSAAQCGCGPFDAFNTSASSTVNVTSRGGRYGYWFLLGPTGDPNYDGTSSEASSWGESQAAAVVYAWDNNLDIINVIVFTDIE